MPWISTNGTPITDIGLPDGVSITRAPASVEPPEFSATIGAAFRLENEVGSFLSSETRGIDPDEVEEGYDPWEDIKGTAYEEHWDKFATVNNRKYADALKSQITREQEDRRTIAAAGGMGFLAAAMAGIAAPTTLIPGGAFIRSARVGYSAGRSALSVSAGAIGVAAQEAALQETQATRSLSESAVAVGGSAMLGSLMGATGAKIMTNLEWNRLADRVAREAADQSKIATDVMEEGAQQLLARGVGADAVAMDTLEDLSIAGRAARVAATGTYGLNPLLRALSSPSKRTRQVLLDMMENPIYLKKNFEGRATGAAVETLAKEWTQGRVGASIEHMDTLYRDMRKSGMKMPRDEFRARVGRAMRRGDQDEAGNEFVTRAAQNWRSQVFDPLKDLAIKEGLLPEDVSVDTAVSYFTRVYNRQMIEAKEPEFKAIVREWANEEIAKVDGSGLPFEAVSKADMDAYVEDIVSSIFNKITGRESVDVPYKIVATTRGPLKERTFAIEDKKIEKFLEDDVEAVGRRYARLMSADVELTRKFGKADLQEVIAEIQQEYEQLRKGAKTEKERALLNARERNDVQDVRDVRDLLRGNFRPQENSSNFARIVNAANTFNYLRSMGGVVLASLPDIARPIMVHGLSRVMGDGIAPLTRNLNAVKLSVKEAKLAGTVAEKILNTRMATWAEITDPYAFASPFERMLHNMATGFSKLNGMVYWNDFMKSFASVLTQNRVLDGVGRYGAIKDKEKAYLAFLGIDEDMAARIAAQFEKHGQTIDGVRVAGTEQWDDYLAQRAYRAAINKDVDSTIVTKGIGDVPIFAHTPIGRALLQFKGFALSTHQRVLIRGLQEGGAGIATGILASTTIGMFVYWLKTLEGGRGDKISDNPGQWIAEGLDRSGLFAIAFEVNNTAEKFGIPGIYGGLQSVFPSKDQSGPASRYAIRSEVDALMGPSFGMAKDIADLLGAAGRQDLSPSDVSAMRRLAPGASLWQLRWMVDNYLVPAAREHVE